MRIDRKNVNNPTEARRKLQKAGIDYQVKADDTNEVIFEKLIQATNPSLRGKNPVDVISELKTPRR